MNKFISETDIEKKKILRQEEWERVRKEDEPLEAPEEEYDPKSLYERLQEQKDKKQLDFEESIKFKNQFRGIDKDEADFLGNVAVQTAKIEKEKREFEKKEMEEIKKAIAEQGKIKEIVKNEEKIIVTNKIAPKNSKSQLSILKKAIKRKSDTQQPEEPTVKKNTDTVSNKPDIETNNNKKDPITSIKYPSVRKCVGVLPGLGVYDNDNTSDSTDKSSDEETDTGLLGLVVGQ